MTDILRYSVGEPPMNSTPKTPRSASQTGVFRPVRDGADQNHEPDDRPEYIVQDIDPAITGVIVIRRAEGEDTAKHADDSPTDSAATG